MEGLGTQHEREHYLDGGWVGPLQPVLLGVIDPSTEDAFIKTAVGGLKDVDRAVAAAQSAFPTFSRTTPAERLELLRTTLEEYNKRWDDIGATLSQEMGAHKALRAADRQAAIVQGD